VKLIADIVIVDLRQPEGPPSGTTFNKKKAVN